MKNRERDMYDHPKKKPENGNVPHRVPEKKAGKRAEPFFDELRERARILLLRIASAVRSFGMAAFYSRERILCGAVCALALVFSALLQSTVFSTLRPFGAVPDIMLLFTVALSVTEGPKWGAVWGIVAAVIIEALSLPEIMLLPLLYMLAGFFCGLLCSRRLLGTAPVRAVLTLGVIPFKGILTAVYMAISPLPVTAAEVFFEVVLPEAAATLLLAAPIHMLMYLCLRPFHRTRAEKVSEK